MFRCGCFFLSSKCIPIITRILVTHIISENKVEFILNKNRNNLATENSNACIRLNTTDYKPAFSKFTPQVKNKKSKN